MGNWNRRYIPRKKGRYDQSEEPSPSSPRPYNTQSCSSGVDDKKVPSWEIDYCNSLKVPWYKILASKRYIYYYPTVLNWDDSAGKEAFHNAKQRYWEMINGFPCSDTLLDPDMFIDEIDWNPYLDPELMTDLDHLYFNPDGVDMVDDLETVTEEVEHGQAQDDMNQFTIRNPWEKDPAQSPQNLKDALQGWRQYNDPWEQSHNQAVDSSKDNAWRSGNESWGQSLWRDDIQDSAQTGTGPQEGWGHSGNSPWNRGHANGQECGNFGNCRYSWGNNHSTGLQVRGRRDKGNGSQQNWKESEYQDNDPNCWDSRKFGKGGERSSHGGCQKRESSLHHRPKFKSSRYQRL